MGIIEKTPEGEVYLLHSAPPRARRQTLQEFLRHYKVVAGLKFLRVRANAAQLVATELSQFVESIPVPSPAQVDAAVASIVPAP